MTAEEWKKVDKSLKFVTSQGITLKIDGYKVYLFLTQKSQFQNAIVFYVNDEFRSKWLTEDCEERRRFCCCKKRSIITKNDYKLYGARSKKAKRELKDRFSYNEYFSYWTNFEKMKKHFIDNNESIELY